MNFNECLKVYMIQMCVCLCTCVYKQHSCNLFSPSIGNAQERKMPWSNSLENMLLIVLSAIILMVFT